MGYLLYFLLSSFSFSLLGASITDVNQVLTEAQARVRAMKTAGGYWHLPSHMGPHYVSQYYLGQRWLGPEFETVDSERLRTLLTRKQLADGSWLTVRDENDPRGDLDATVFNYWALKVMGVPLDAPMMTKARDFVLSKGGLEKTTLFTKLFLALFRNCPWNVIPNIPYSIFLDNALVNYQMMAQWVTPHMMPLAYLRKHKLTRLPSADFKLGELQTGRWDVVAVADEYDDSRDADDRLVRKLLARQQREGSWGGYTISTLLSLMVLDHFHGDAAAIAKGKAFLEHTYLADDVPNAYQGRVMDGRYWDTALLVWGMRESAAQGPDLTAAEGFLASSQVAGGGFPFGLDFESDPDVDDTAIALMALRDSSDRDEVKHKAVSWILSMQNDDGGWAAFAKNNIERPMLMLFLKPFLSSVDLFDDSSPDVTGHVLEALAASGYRMANSQAVRRAVKYLESSQDREVGAWYGRWGLNYLYGTAAVVVGAARVGVSPAAGWLRRSVNWVESRQNPDGGFGESTRSYADKSLAGKGISTPSQTAWALLALLEGGQAHSAASSRAVDYLVREFRRKGEWEDATAVGTGHPKIAYMEYPVYQHAFPLIALGRWKQSR